MPTNKSILNHIVIEYSDQLPASIPLNIINRLKQEKYTIGTIARETVPYLSLEWFLPTALIIYFTRPFFEEFLKNSGSNFFNRLFPATPVNNNLNDEITIWLKNEVLRARQIDVKIISTSKSKINNANTQSKAISIVAFLKNGKRIKFLLDENYDGETWNNGIDKMFALLINHYQNFPKDEITENLTKLSNKDPEYISIYNNEYNNWILKDLNNIVQISIQSKIKNKLNEISLLVESDEILKALELLKNTIELSSFKTQVVNLISRYNRLKKEDRLGSIGFENSDLKQNKILNSLLELIQEIKNNFDIKDE